MILVAAMVLPGGFGEGVRTRDCRNWIWEVVLFRVERRSDFGDILGFFTDRTFLGFVELSEG